ncbi:MULTISPECIES: DUF262 domain-containing protein [unclassified Adlercreutzia]|uniref:DUF262 domain-containing protein n=1 Tax=unclassified Adlercreutzia TaxID=2636013 RepID=UPI0013EC40DB|nr:MULTISPECIES: DUF262 domain-containing protein [unclassified Adlercreutzia]
MKTSNDALLGLLGREHVQFVVPTYQRLYSWKHRQCEELWLDVHRAAKSNLTHFVGTLLYEQDAEDAAGITRLAVVDGQQRLTTLTLMLAAFARYLDAHADADASVDAASIERRFLKTTPADGAADAAGATGTSAGAAGTLADGGTSTGALADAASQAKLLLSRTDRDTLLAVVAREELPENPSENVMANLAFFEGKMAEDGFDPAAFWRGVNLLFVVGAQVDRSDNAQLIFESLNSKGLPLTTADLVRNYLLLAETHAEQTRLYDEYWSPIEGMFAPDPGSLRLDNAIQGWLSLRFRKVRAKGTGEVYSVFKRYVEDEFEGTTESLLAELRNFSLVWAENYRYHAVKKFRSSFNWAINGAPTLVADRKLKETDHEGAAQKYNEAMSAVDAAQ